MGLSDGPCIIIVVVIVPVTFFTTALALGILYRRYHPLSRSHRSAEQIWKPHPSHSSSITHVCSDCKEEHLEVVPSTAREAIPDQDFGTGPPTKTSLAQPHFSEVSVSIRRISTSERQDRITRINSLASSLTANDDSATASLRKLSGGSQWAQKGADDLQTQSGVVSVGTRRPSVLSAGDLKMGDNADGPGAAAGNTLEVRRVSAGGVEDVVRIRGSSLSDQSQILRDQGTPISPQVPINHPFSNPSHSSSSASHRRFSSIPSLQTIAPSPGPPPPHPPPEAPIKRAIIRPDSILLAKSPSTSDFSRRVPLNSSATDASVMTASSTRAIKSPSIDTERTPEMFQAWSGFPAKVQTVSHEADKQADGHPADITPNLLIVNSSAPVSSVPLFLTDRRSIDRKERSPSTSSVEAGIASEQQRSSSLTSPRQPVSLGAPTPDKKRTSKITYLADVVKEQAEERKRKSLLVDGDRDSFSPYPRRS